MNPPPLLLLASPGRRKWVLKFCGHSNYYELYSKIILQLGYKKNNLFYLPIKVIFNNSIYNTIIEGPNTTKKYTSSNIIKSSTNSNSTIRGKVSLPSTTTIIKNPKLNSININYIKLIYN
jgi:hypothetical protein